MVETPFRITPSLGPDLHQSAVVNYWDTVGQPHGVSNANMIPSYQPGSLVTGNDGHLYRYVKAGAAFTKDDGLSINESTNVASADASSPVWTAPISVADGAWFHARSVTPAAS